ncbi:MAG: class I SAM-dependent methyltransferase [Gammaproteobacteria bacterium]
MENIISRIKSKSSELFSFFKVLILHPRSIGALCPSSSYLANAMAEHIQLKPGEIVVELGSGAGVITEALLKHGCPPNQIVAVEFMPAFAEKLRTRFPNITTIEGNAIDLVKLLSPYPGVKYVVSSLPLRSLPVELSKGILEQIEKILPSNGYYIQFTYSYKHDTFGLLPNFKRIHAKRIWRNLPPARVDVRVKA